MGGTRMEDRVDDLEKGVQEVVGQVARVDSKLDHLIQQLGSWNQQNERNDNRFESLKGAVSDLGTLMMREKKGKAVEQDSSPPEMMTEWTKERNLSEEEMQPEQSKGRERESIRRSQPEPPYLNEREFWSRREHHHRHLELPVFNGYDPLGWVNRVERFFMLAGILVEERIPTVLTCLKGAALEWYQFREQRRSFVEWAEFKRELLHRFGSDKMKAPHKELVSIKQLGSVAEYREKFEALTEAIPRAEEPWLMGVFMSGLEEEIKAEVRLFGPANLEQLMEIT